MKQKIKRRGIACISAGLCLALSACGGGGSDNPPPPPPATQLNADNLLDATGVSALALHRVQGDLPLALSAVLGPYLQQAPAGEHACSKSGSLTLDRPSALVWNFGAKNCDIGGLLLRSGQLQLDATQVETQGLKLLLKDLAYADSNAPGALAQTANGAFNFLIPVASDLGKRSTGNLSFGSNGRSDQYSEFYIASKTSDSKFVQYGLKLKSPRFSHELTLVLDDASKSLTIQADDGSVLTVTEQGGGARLELRRAAGEAPSVSRVLSRAELEGAVSRAMQ